MKPNIISIAWTVVAVLAGIFLSFSFNFFRKKKNPSRINVIGNPNHPTLVATAATTSIIRPLSQNYEVFLNFRGVDTRKTFTDHLYQRLVDVRVSVFRDNEELHIGEEIHPNLLAAIQSSKISIPIISQNYANSKWCLRELVQILRCRETIGQIVIPIFYHVDPSDVRHQTGNFGKGFSLQKKRHTSKVVQEWKDALEKVASLKVWELNNNADGYEGKLVKQVVEKVLIVLNKTTLVVPEYLVGVEEHAKKIMEMVELQSHNDVQVVLIYGMGGIGKTTLAKFLYNQLSTHFHFCSFLENVRDTSMQQLRKQLISNILKQDWPQEIYNANEGIGIIKGRFNGMKVLLVLDDVDHKDQFDALVGRCDWLGLGSVMIITTRNSDVLNPWHVKLPYELKELDFDQSFQLFYKHALQGKDSHFGEFEAIARGIISTTGGLPLAIEVIGCLLSGKGLDFWIETLKKLKRIPNESVQMKLKLSYEALTYEQKQIFIDIACLYSFRKESFMYMWDDCNYYPRFGIEVLRSLCLIKVEHQNQYLTMHHQLRLLGREIVRQESDYQLGRCKILWDPNEALEVMETKQYAEKLKVLELQTCYRLKATPDFSTFKELEVLDLHDCKRLSVIHPSICRLANTLKRLIVSNCTELEMLPQELGKMEELRELHLDCTPIKEVPIVEGFMTKLETLSAQNCRELTGIPDSIGSLTKLKSLVLWGCVSLIQIPRSIGKLSSLSKLDLGFTNITELPRSIWNLDNLVNLGAMGLYGLTDVPKEIGQLTCLETLRLEWTPIYELPNLPCGLRELRFSGCLMESLPNLSYLTSLVLLDLYDMGVDIIPELLPSDLKILLLVGCKTLRKFLKFEHLKHLSNLTIKGCSELMEINALEGVPSLRKLAIHGCKKLSALSGMWNSLTALRLDSCDELKSLPDLSTLKNLAEFWVVKCNIIVEIQGLDTIKCLRDLHIYNCPSLERIGDLSCLTTLRWLGFGNCPKLRDFDYSCIDKLTYLNVLRLYGEWPTQKFPDLPKLRKLTSLEVIDFEGLTEIPNLQELKSLMTLGIYRCKSLENLPNFSEFTKLGSLSVRGCEKLAEIQGLEGLNSFRQLFIHGCPSLKQLPDLPEWMISES